MTLPYQDPPLQKSVLLRSNTCLADRQVYDLTSSFKSWLISKNYSSATIRNYLSDINAYFESNKTTDIFSPDTVSLYLQTIQKNPAYSRYISSLSKFFQFAQDQNLVKNNPLKIAKKAKPSADEIINQYSQYLNKKHFSQSTVKNYLNDIKQFIDWSKNQQNPSTSTQGCDESHPYITPSNQNISRGLIYQTQNKIKSIFRNKGGFSES